MGVEILELCLEVGDRLNTPLNRFKVAMRLVNNLGVVSSILPSGHPYRSSSDMSSKRQSLSPAATSLQRVLLAETFYL